MSESEEEGSQYIPTEHESAARQLGEEVREAGRGLVSIISLVEVTQVRETEAEAEAGGEDLLRLVARLR